MDQLTSQLEDADAALDTTGAKLDSVRSKLERNWDAKQFDQAQELAQQAITQTEAKAELLRQKLAALEELGTKNVCRVPAAGEAACGDGGRSGAGPQAAPEHSKKSAWTT